MKVLRSNIFCAVVIFGLVLTVSSCDSILGNETENDIATGPQIDLTNYVGLAIASGSVSSSEFGNLSTGSTELVAIDESGNQAPVFAPGLYPVSRFLIAPNSKVYLLFSRPVDLDDPTDQGLSGGTLLAELDSVSGELSAVISDLQSVSWNNYSSTYRNSPIQFDSEGRLYVMGEATGGNRVLRRVGTDGSQDLVNDNIRIDDFLVMEDGTVIMTGSTASSGQYWIRQLSPSGSLANIDVSNTHGVSIFMKRFPNGRLHFGRWGADFGVFTLKEDLTGFEERPWISGTAINSVTYEPHNDIENIPSNDGGWWFSHPGSFFETVSGVLFGIAYNGAITEYYPDPTSAVSISIDEVASVVGVLDQLIIAGTNGLQNTLVLYNTTTKSETDLLGDRNIEVYDVNFVAQTNTIMFSGLDFAVNQRVVGRIPLTGSDPVVTVPVSGNIELVNFSTF